jgi:hypothetical protein
MKEVNHKDLKQQDIPGKSYPPKENMARDDR